MGSAADYLSVFDTPLSVIFFIKICALPRLMLKFPQQWKKLKTGHLRSAFRENSPLKRSEWHVLTTDHTVLSATHTFIHEWNEPSCLYSQASAHYRTLAGTHFPSHRRLKAELAWVAGYITIWYAHPKTVTHPSNNRPIVRRPGIELTTIESHVRRPNHYRATQSLKAKSELLTFARGCHFVFKFDENSVNRRVYDKRA